MFCYVGNWFYRHEVYVLPVTVEQLKGAPVLIIGCGDLGTELGLRLIADGSPALGIRRNVAVLPPGLPSLALDYSSAQMSQLADWDGDVAVLIPKPVAMTDAGYQQGYVAPVVQFLNACANRPRKILFVSSTRVYGDCQGEWVDESSATQPEGFAGARILEAERLLLESIHQVTIVRPGGIYGRWPSALVRRIEQGRLCPSEPLVYSNRIHRDDCAGFLWHLLRGLVQGEVWENCYLCVDNEPVARRQFENWLGLQLGVTEILENDAPLRSVTSKRCRNTRMLGTGYRIQFPDYRSGYRAMLETRSP